MSSPSKSSSEPEVSSLDNTENMPSFGSSSSLPSEEASNEPMSIEKSEPTSVEEGEPMSVEEGEPTSVEEGEPMSVEEGEPTSVEEGESTSVEKGSPEEEKEESLEKPSEEEEEEMPESEGSVVEQPAKDKGVLDKASKTRTKYNRTKKRLASLDDDEKDEIRNEVITEFMNILRISKKKATRKKFARRLNGLRNDFHQALNLLNGTTKKRPGRKSRKQPASAIEAPTEGSEM
jgi:hypothetical protein